MRIEQQNLTNLVRVRIPDRMLARHDGGYLHCDVRLTNIIYDPKTKKWTLIDFEHGRSIASDDFSGPLKDWDDGTCSNGVYTNVRPPILFLALNRLVSTTWLTLFSTSVVAQSYKLKSHSGAKKRRRSLAMGLSNG